MKQLCKYIIKEILDILVKVEQQVLTEDTGDSSGLCSLVEKEAYDKETFGRLERQDIYDIEEAWAELPRRTWLYRNNYQGFFINPVQHSDPVDVWGAGDNFTGMGKLLRLNFLRHAMKFWQDALDNYDEYAKSLKRRRTRRGRDW